MRIAFFLIPVFLFVSCVKEEFHENKFDGSINLTPGVAIPAGYSHLEFEKYLKEAPVSEVLRISEDGFMTLFYSSDVFSEIIGDVLTFSPVSINSILLNETGSTINLLAPGATIDLMDSILIPFDPDQSVTRIDSIHLMGGTLQMSITTSGLNGTITFRFPGVLRQGTQCVITRTISNPDFSQDLSGYTIIPEQDTGGGQILRCVISIHLQNPSGPVSDGSSLFNIRTNFNSMDFETLYGDFSGLAIDLPSFNLSPHIFTEFIEGHCDFTNPEMKVIFANSCGVPLGLSFSRLEVTDRDNNRTAVTGSGVPSISNPEIIAYSALSEEGVTIEDSLVLNETNSNFPDILALNPNSIDLTASVRIVTSMNPGSTFIRYDSELDISAALEIPLEGKAEFLILLDTITFDYLSTALPVPDEIERLIVRINITNSFPVTLIPQVYLLDENRILLDSLFTGTQKIEGATDTNGDGKPDPHIQDPISIDLPREKINILSETHYLITKGEITTTNYPSEDVRIYSSCYLDYNIGLIAQLQINTGKR